MPSRSHFIKVDALPVLGTGKLDLRALKRIAMDRLGERDS
jgi:acyl-[acyl-carrier-protein]-phospholipid O-acyltransferase / long-chain-fatty-acid--[acyl-carrier-protein] ligase